MSCTQNPAEEKCQSAGSTGVLSNRSQMVDDLNQAYRSRSARRGGPFIPPDHNPEYGRFLRALRPYRDMNEAAAALQASLEPDLKYLVELQKKLTAGGWPYSSGEFNSKLRTVQNHLGAFLGFSEQEVETFRATARPPFSETERRVLTACFNALPGYPAGRYERPVEGIGRWMIDTLHQATQEVAPLFDDQGRRRSEEELLEQEAERALLAGHPVPAEVIIQFPRLLSDFPPDLKYWNRITARNFNR